MTDEAGKLLLEILDKMTKEIKLLKLIQTNTTRVLEDRRPHSLYDMEELDYEVDLFRLRDMMNDTSETKGIEE